MWEQFASAFGRQEWVLVALACAIGFAGSLLALSLASRRSDQGPYQVAWIFAGALALGCGAWAAQLLVLLALQPAAALSLNFAAVFLPTVLSVGGCGFAFYSAGRTLHPALRGTVIGASIAMANIAAASFAGYPFADGPVLVSTMSLGVALSAMSLVLVPANASRHRTLAGAAFLTAAICTIHLGGAAALGATAPSVASGVFGGMWMAVGMTTSVLVMATVAIIADISAHYRFLIARTEEEGQRNTKMLTEALNEADRSNASQSQFLATMSHELRTPLNAIIGFSEIMENEVFGPLGNERYREYAGDVHRSGAHLLGLINDILDLAKYDAGKLELREDMVDLSAIVAETLALVTVQADKAGVQIHNTIGDEPVWATADAKRMKQVLLNLLSNAVKFTPAAGEITVSSARGPQGLSLCVADTGIGMSPEQIPKAMERFGQIDSTLGRKYEGTGLGLPLVKSLMELHGGSLHIASKLHAGTTVTATLPTSRCLEPERTRAVA